MKDKKAQEGNILVTITVGILLLIAVLTIIALANEAFRDMLKNTLASIF